MVENARVEFHARCRRHAASRTQVSGRSSDVSIQPAPAKRTARAKSKAITTTKTQKAKGRLKTADNTEDNEDEVTVVGFTMTNTVPVHRRGVHGDIRNGPLRTVLVGGTILTQVKLKSHIKKYTGYVCSPPYTPLRPCRTLLPSSTAITFPTKTKLLDKMTCLIPLPLSGLSLKQTSTN